MEKCDAERILDMLREKFNIEQEQVPIASCYIMCGDGSYLALGEENDEFLVLTPEEVSAYLRASGNSV